MARAGCTVVCATLALAASVASGASCGGSSFTDADAAPDGPSVDATGGTADVSNDGPSTSHDSGSVVDAPGDATGTGWCATHPGHTFCEDFDESPNVTAFLGTWSTFQQTGGIFKFDTSGAPSAPNALEATGTNSAKVVVLKTFPISRTATKVRMDFDLRINSSGSVGLLSAAGLAALAFGSSISDGFASIAIANGPALSAAWAASADAGTAADAGTFKASNATGTFPATGVWAARYGIEVDYSASGGCVQIFEGPTPLLSSCLALPPTLAHPTVVSVVVGDYTAGFGNTGSIDVEFDDVTFDET
jgi:hypothetical protein